MYKIARCNASSQSGMFQRMGKVKDGFVRMCSFEKGGGV